MKGYEPEKTNPAHLASFLASNAAIAVTVKQTVQEQDKILIELENSGQAFAMKKLSGMRFFGEKLIIANVRREENVSMDTSAKTVLTQFVETHYKRDDKFISFANLGGQQIEGISFDFNNVAFMKTLFFAMAQKCSDVESISFANDKIHSLQPFSLMPQYISRPLNISFEGNDISDFKQLDHLKKVKLRELELKNNPIKTQQPEQTYQSEVARRFPKLKYLDGEKSSPAIDFGLPTYLTSGVLPPLKGNLYDSPQSQSLVENFLKKYYHVYDSNRNGLLDVYMDNSFFSLTFSTSSKHFSEKGRQDITQKYKSCSRNLTLTKDLDRKVSMLKLGRIEILHHLNTLPQTRHSLDDLRVDAFLVKQLGTTQVLCITIHGYFWESASNTNRSYDRTFLLTPVVPNSTAAQQGWPATIMNDILHIRSYVASPPVVESSPSQSAAQPTPQSPQTLQPPVSLLGQHTPTVTSPVQQTNEDDLKIQQIMRATCLKPEWAKICLQQNGGDLNRAFEAFNTLKAQNAITADMLQL